MGEIMKTQKLLWGISLFVFAVSFSEAQSPELALKIYDVSLNEVKIKFATFPMGNNPQAIVRDAVFSEKNNYEIGLGTAPCSYNSNHFFEFELYVRPIRSREWQRIHVHETPSGPFLDQMKTVDFVIIEGDRREPGAMNLHLHSSYGDPFLELELDATERKDAIHNVRLGSERMIPLILKNKLKDIPVIVKSVSLDSDDLDFWKGMPKNIELAGWVIDGGMEKSLPPIEIHPRASKIIPNTIFRLKGGEDTSLKITFKYEPQDGGKIKELPAAIKIRFLPSLWVILLAIVIGAFLGTVARALGMAAGRNNRDWLKRWILGFTYTFFGALILELLAIVLIENKSVFQVFGLKLDPYQFLHVMIMSILAGLLGLNVAAVIKGILGLGRSQIRKRAAAVPQGGEK
jgi:hypothetical protein